MVCQEITFDGTGVGNGNPQKLIDGGLNLSLLEIVFQPDADCSMQLFEDTKAISGNFRFAQDAIVSIPGKLATGNVNVVVTAGVNYIWEIRMYRGVLNGPSNTSFKHW